MSNYSQNLIKWRDNQAPKISKIIQRSNHKCLIQAGRTYKFCVPRIYPGITNVTFTGFIYSIILTVGGAIHDKWFNPGDMADNVSPFYQLSDNRVMPHFTSQLISFEITTNLDANIVIEYDDVTYDEISTEHIFPIIQNNYEKYNFYNRKSKSIILYRSTVSLRLITEDIIYGAELEVNNIKWPFCQINTFEWVIDFDSIMNLRSNNLINFNDIDDIKVNLANEIQYPILIEQKAINFAKYCGEHCGGILYH